MMMTDDFDKEEAILIHNGVGWLNDLSKQQYKKTFVKLDSKAKEIILRRIENSKLGSRWLSLLLTTLGGGASHHHRKHGQLPVSL